MKNINFWKDINICFAILKWFYFLSIMVSLYIYCTSIEQIERFPFLIFNFFFFLEESFWIFLSLFRFIARILFYFFFFLKKKKRNEK